jgi:hypothetical protein
MNSEEFAAKGEKVAMWFRTHPFWAGVLTGVFAMVVLIGVAR